MDVKSITRPRNFMLLSPPCGDPNSKNKPDSDALRYGENKPEPLLKAGAAHARPNKRKRRDWPFSKISNVLRVASAAPRLCRIMMMLISTSL